MFRHEFGQSTWHVLDGKELAVSRGARQHDATLAGKSWGGETRKKGPWILKGLD